MKKERRYVVLIQYTLKNKKEDEFARYLLEYMLTAWRIYVEARHKTHKVIAKIDEITFPKNKDL